MLAGAERVIVFANNSMWRLLQASALTVSAQLCTQRAVVLPPAADEAAAQPQQNSLQHAAGDAHLRHHLRVHRAARTSVAELHGNVRRVHRALACTRSWRRPCTYTVWSVRDARHTKLRFFAQARALFATQTTVQRSRPCTSGGAACCNISMQWRRRHDARAAQTASLKGHE
jgi:hypothetical protein